jgi:hypothetical protein
MKPLLFLTLRSLVNGVRRSLTSVRRLVSLIFVAGYYFYFFVFRALPTHVSAGVPPNIQGRIEFPAMQTLDAVVFAVFAVISLFMMLGMFAQRAGFRAADVDVLFATPVSPKVVLVFRLVREYLATLLFPLFFAIVFFRPAASGWQAMFRDMPNPGSSGLVLRMMSLSWLLMSMCWVAIAYAVSLFVNRSDRQSDLNKRIIAWGSVALVAALVSFLWWRTRGITDLSEFVGVLQSPVLRVAFFTATAATYITLAPLAGSWTLALFGFGLLVAVMLIAFRLAMSQVDWLYDQAAVRGFGQQELRSLQAKGDYVGLAILRAQSGKAKPQRRTWMHRVRLQGPGALLWKEYFLQKRGMTSLLIVILLPMIVMSFVPLMMPAGGGDRVGPIMFVLLQAMCILTITMNLAATGSIEVLRRVDVQKPLPFSPTAITSTEIVSKAAWAVVANLAADVIALVARPHWWQYVAASFVYSTALSLSISATVFLVTVLFPDTDDRSQRQFHRLVGLLFVVVAAGPGFGLGVFLLAALQMAPFVAAVAAAVVTVGITVGITAVAGNLYAAYNPSD